MSIVTRGQLDSCFWALDTKKGKEKSFACENSMSKTSVGHAEGPQGGEQVGLQTRMEQVATGSLETWGLLTTHVPSEDRGHMGKAAATVKRVRGPSMSQCSTRPSR